MYTQYIERDDKIVLKVIISTMSCMYQMYRVKIKSCLAIIKLT